MSILTLIVCLPLVGAVAVALIPRNYRFGVRVVALLASFLSMVFGIIAFWRFTVGASDFQFIQDIPWVDSIGIHLHFGADGLNIGLILMGTVVAFAATCVAWEIKEREKEFYLLLLVMSGGILGAFASLDLFFFFFFHELALIPTFIMIGVWGRGPNKNYATFQITLYLSLGALIALVGLITLYLQAGARTFDIPLLTRQLAAAPLSAPAQHLIFPFLLFGFGILVSLWPFHTWAPLGYGSAPTSTAMLHAGVLKKFGLYGLIRIALPMLPEAARTWMPVLGLLCLGNILYIGLVAVRQKDFNLLIGNSSVAHMGFAFLGIASLSLIGIAGTVIIMVAHGFLASLTFAISGYLFQQTGTLEMRELGGLLRRLPFIGTVLVMAAFAGCGLPGFANFVGEIMVFFGAWTPLKVVTGFAIWGGLIIGAVYMLRALRNMLYGPLAERWELIRDASGPWRRLPFALLLASLLLFGMVPRLLTDRIRPVAEAIAKTVAPAQAAAPVQTAQVLAPAQESPR
jgi:NADH-quinone oxidoreductase subunit M